MSIPEDLAQNENKLYVEAGSMLGKVRGGAGGSYPTQIHKINFYNLCFGRNVSSDITLVSTPDQRSPARRKKRKSGQEGARPTNQLILELVLELVQNELRENLSTARADSGGCFPCTQFSFSAQTNFHPELLPPSHS